MQSAAKIQGTSVLRRQLGGNVHATVHSRTPLEGCERGYMELRSIGRSHSWHGACRTSWPVCGKLGADKLQQAWAELSEDDVLRRCHPAMLRQRQEFGCMHERCQPGAHAD